MATKIQRKSNSAKRTRKFDKFDQLTMRRLYRGEITYKREAVRLKPTTVDEKNRTVRGIVCTENPVVIIDWAKERYVEEVLLSDGMQPIESARLLNAHNGWRAQDVIGSVMQFQRGTNETSIEANLVFSSASDVEPIFVRVKEGHLRGLSIGGKYTKKGYIEIAPGETSVVMGRKFTAGELWKRVVFDWACREVSVVPFGADEASVTRSNRKRRQTETTKRKAEKREAFNRVLRESDPSALRGDHPMKFSVRAVKFLRTLGLSRVAAQSTQETAAFVRSLSKKQRALLFSRSPNAEALMTSLESDPTDDDDDDDSTCGTKTLTKPKKVERNATEEPSDQVDAKEVRRAERDRQKAIREMATSQVPEKLVQRAIDEEWTPDEAGRRFFEAIRNQAGKPVGFDAERGPGIHAKRGLTVEGLQAGLLQRFNVNFEDGFMRTGAAQAVLRKTNADWIVNASQSLKRTGKMNEKADRAIEEGNKYSNMSLYEVCRRCLKADGKSIPSDQDEMIQRSFSSSSLGRVLGTVVSAMMVQGYMDYEDTTRGWVSEADWSDFRDNQPVGLEPGSGLQLHVRGKKAPHVEVSDFGEKYKVNRFVGKFKIDEQDIIDDNIGLGQVMPGMIGSMAASLRPDLIYALLMANGTLTDGIALFSSNAARNNDITSNALGITGLTACRTRMASFVVSSANAALTKPLQMKAGWLIVPEALSDTADIVTKSSKRISGNTTADGDKNPHDGKWKVASDARLDTGVTSPLTGLTVAGSATKFYVLEKTGMQTLQVGYRRGTGRAPQLRTYRLTGDGEWGIGWDCNFDVGATVIRARGMIRSAA